MKKQEKIKINTTFNPDLVMQLKLLAVKKGKKLNDLLEEAIQDLLAKYSEK